MRLGHVICAAICVTIGLGCLGLAIESHAQELTQHYERKDADKGPRALALVEITDKGKAHLVPIAIMMNGKFYDAESYKASPVPMALDFGIVYEGFSSGVSQGLFTITQPGQLNHEWIAEGTWLPDGARPKTDKQKYSPPVIDEGGGRDDDHPVLHRRAGSEADKDETKPAAPASSTSPSTSSQPSPASSTGAGSATNPSPTAPSSSTPSSPAPAASSSPSTAPASGTAPPAAKPSDTGKASDTAPSKPSDSTTAKAPDASASRTSDPNQPMSDPNRPILRRGKPDPSAHHEPFVNFDDPVEAAGAAKEAGKEAAAANAVAAASVKTVTAISDAGGPDPRPYTYDLKPAEEAIYRNKMLELAGQQLRPTSQQGSTANSSSSSSSARSKSASAKGSNSATGKASQRKKDSPVKPEFEGLSLRIFDLSNSNEPVLVLSARTPVPAAATAGAQVPQEITLIARTNLEGELQKLFFAQTDSRHLYVSPRMELIDAVDADGDGRGELLFRRTSDSGSAYAIYRVTSDGLWPLWEPAP